MEMTKNFAGWGFLTPAQFAAKWWADRLDGTVNDIRLDKQFLERVNLEKIIHPENAEDVDDIVETFKDEKEKRLSSLLLFPAERRKFEEELTKIIEEQLEKREISVLCVVEDRAQLELSWAAERAEIDCGKNSVFMFAPFVAMFVSKNKVEVRFDENDSLETLYEIEKVQIESSFLKEEKSLNQKIEKENHI